MLSLAWLDMGMVWAWGRKRERYGGSVEQEVQITIPLKGTLAGHYYLLWGTGQESKAGKGRKRKERGRDTEERDEKALTAWVLSGGHLNLCHL